MRAIGLALVFVAFGSGIAGADPIDFSVPPNGVWPPGQERSPVVTPEFSPIQLPAPDVGATETIAYPYLSPWVHDVIPVPPGRGLEVQGAVRARIPDHLVVLNGHCLFGTADGPAESTFVHADAGPLTIDLHPQWR